MADESLIGRQLNNFKIESLIGRGGMATVYLGRDVKLNRPVAIKVIDARFRDNPAYAQRFVREAQSVSAWRHENIVQIYYADDEDGLYYFVMEYIDGEDLGKKMAAIAKQGQLLPHPEVLRVGRSVAKALDYAHQQGVIHRDVKPANVLISRDGQVVLSDFGLALIVAEGSLGEVFGSSRYIAPEQARRSADAVPQSDLYSLGVILYQMLTGAVPFDDPSPTAVALQHLTQPPPAPRDANPALSLDVESVLLKALSKAPADRYQSGAELIDALEAALQGAAPSSVAASAAVNQNDDLIGLQLDEYRLEKLLGKGGMAAVYQGVDVRLNRLVGVKVIDTPHRTDAEYIKRFEREAQAIAQLEHPHIVGLYRYGKAQGLLYIAMQYIEGQDLQARLSHYAEKGAAMPPDEISRITRQICLALDYAHQKGVIHRDVKPSNIILDTKGDAYLTDFGLVLLTDLGTRGEILGSPHYLSPEQAVSSAGAVPQSDLYAMGVILYRCFTGALPFDAEDPLDVAMLQMSQSPTPPSEITPAVSPALEKVILKALEKEPENRYASGLALADALDAALQQKPSAVRPPSAPTKISPPPPLPAAPVVAAASPPPGATAAPESIVSRMSKEMARQPKTSPAKAAKALPPQATETQEKSRMPLYAGIIAVLLLIAALVFFFTRGNDHEAPPAQVLASKTPTQQKTPAFTPVKASPTADAPVAAAPTKTLSSTDAPTPLPTPTLSPTVTPPTTPTLLPSATPTVLPLAVLTATATLTPPPYRLAFTKWDGGKHAVWTVNLDGSEKTWVSDYASSPAWTADGERIVFLGETGINSQPRTPPDGSEGIWRMTPDGLYFRQLLEDGVARSVTVSADGIIAFDAKRGADYAIYFVDGEGRELPVQIPGETPSWSPDGGWLVAKACRPNCGLWLTRRDGSGAAQLTFNGGDGLPAWSPDNSRIAFSRPADGGLDIFTVNLDGSNLLQLTTVANNDTLPVWTPDSQQIIFRSTRNGVWQIYVMNSDGSDQHPLISDNVGGNDDWAVDRMSVIEIP